MQRVLPKCDPVTKVTIVSRGMALGYTMSLPAEDRYLHSKTEFEDKIAGMLGGNVSETIVFGDTTTGSSNDIEKATNLARAMVTQYGMSEKLGPLAFGKKEEMVFLGREISEQRNYSDEVAAKIDSEVREIIDRAFARATEALTTHRAVLDRLAELLVEKETIEHEEFESLFEGILPPRSGGPTPQKVGAVEATDGDGVEPDVEPGTEERGRQAPPSGTRAAAGLAQRESAPDNETRRKAGLTHVWPRNYVRHATVGRTALCAWCAGLDVDGDITARHAPLEVQA